MEMDEDEVPGLLVLFWLMRKDLDRTDLDSIYTGSTHVSSILHCENLPAEVTEDVLAVLFQQ